MTLLQVLANIAVFAVNGLATFVIGWAMNRWILPRLGGGIDILTASLTAIPITTTLWFAALWLFGDGPNFFGTALMGGTGGLIAILLAVAVHRNRRRRGSTAIDVGDTFA